MTKQSITADALTIRPANRASWDDLMAVLAPARCHGKPCFCQRFKVRDRGWFTVDEEQLAHNLRTQTNCGKPAAKHTRGLVAYLADEPVGWCSVGPRLEHPNLILNRMLSAGRDEDLADPGVWAATCFIIRKGYRGRGYTYALARAAVEFARSRGATALEGYSMITHPDQTITWGELHVGSYNIFKAAGLRQVSQPSKRRIVMRIDF
ncbi:MAG: GNAT family N-acetyltransferase [Anaerolineales bacterium]|nr:MAG: GNAT family N-acetyltransferase [Anaerolineales bacterium]